MIKLQYYRITILPKEKIIIITLILKCISIKDILPY